MTKPLTQSSALLLGLIVLAAGAAAGAATDSMASPDGVWSRASAVTVRLDIGRLEAILALRCA